MMGKSAPRKRMMDCGDKIGQLQCHGESDSGECIAPTGSSGERDFLGERIALWARTTLIASAGFFLANFLIYALWPPASGAAPSFSQPEVLFHLAAIAVLLVAWLAARRPGLSEAALRWLDGITMVACLALYTGMAASMPLAWRPEMLVCLIAISLLLYRAAIVPSAPRRTAIISTVACLPIPLLAFFAYAHVAPRETSRGSSVAYAFLWSALAVALSTFVSYVTFRLRKSVARHRKLGQYTLTEKIGEGGMGVVYRAEHEMLRRPTAIKLLPPGRAGEDSLKRFEREVQLTARLTNPHTVSVYDFGRTPDGVFYYVMEYLDGVDLETLVHESGPLAPGRAVRILRQMCAALAEAHGIGLDPPGHQAGQRHPLRARRHPRHRQGSRLRPRQGPLRHVRGRNDEREHPSRHAAVHGARGDPRREERGPAQRPLCRGRGRLLPARRARPSSPARARSRPSITTCRRSPSRSRAGSDARCPRTSRRSSCAASPRMPSSVPRARRPSPGRSRPARACSPGTKPARRATGTRGRRGRTRRRRRERARGRRPR